MTNNSSHNAAFWHRLLANLTDNAAFMLLYSIVLLSVFQSQNLQQALNNFIIFIIVILLVGLLSTTIYLPFFTTNFGGGIGKLLNGLAVVDNSGKFLTFKQNLFRYNVGYILSSTFFGLGFFAILKDPARLAWHDKAIGSKVIVKSNLWPVGLIATITFYALAGFIFMNGLTTASSGPLKNEFEQLFNLYMQVQRIKQFENMPSADGKKTTPKTISQSFSIQAQKVGELLDNQRYNEANTSAQALLETAQSDYEKAIAYQLIGEANFFLKDAPAAKKNFTLAVVSYPDFALGYAYLAETELYGGEWKEALEHSKKAVTLEPNNAHYQNVYGRALFENNQDEASLEALKKAIQLDPNNSLYKNDLAEIQKIINPSGR